MLDDKDASQEFQEWKSGTKSEADKERMSLQEETENLSQELEKIREQLVELQQEKEQMKSDLVAARAEVEMRYEVRNPSPQVEADEAGQVQGAA